MHIRILTLVSLPCPAQYEADINMLSMYLQITVWYEYPSFKCVIKDISFSNIII